MEIKIADDPVPLAAITGAATAFSAGCKAQLPSHLIPKAPQGQSQVGHKQQHWWHSVVALVAQGCVVLLLWLIHFCIPWLECAMKREQELELGR